MFRNRGEVPDINTGAGESKDNGGYSAPHYSHYWNRRFMIIQYDKTFVAIELISWLIILLTILAVYLFSYKVSFEDPIAQMKSNFLTAQFITIVISIIITGVVTFFTRKSKEKLIRNLIIVAIISLIVNFIFLGLKLDMDNKYNETTFGEFYEQYEQNKNNDNKNTNKIAVGLSGVKMSRLKEAYVDESVNAYTNFSVKVMLYMIIYIFVVFIIFYLAYRLFAIERKREKLSRDDAILYDKENNIKF